VNPVPFRQPRLAGCRLEFADEFDGDQLDLTRWIPAYLPQWSSRSRAAARYRVRDGRLILEIQEDQPPWCPELDGATKVSSLQTGVYAGEVGSPVGQHRFDPRAVVREPQPPTRLYTPLHGYFEVRAKAVADPRNMIALWMIGYEDVPERSGEICVCEIFGRDVRPGNVRVGVGVHPFFDPGLVDDFSRVSLDIDATDDVYGGGLPLHQGDESLQRMIDNAAAAGGWSVVITGLGDEETYDLYLKAVSDCCDYAAERDVALVLKPHGSLTATGPLCRRAIERVGHPNFTLMYDPGNILYYSEGRIDPIEDCAAVNGMVTSLSVKDYRHPRDVALTPGTGQIDFPALIARLRKGGFTHGAALIEMVSPGDPAHTLAEVRKARRFIERLLSAGG
jgi:sugar phosphate isomerase/epimerase